MLWVFCLSGLALWLSWVLGIVMESLGTTTGRRPDLLVLLRAPRWQCAGRFKQVIAQQKNPVRRSVYLHILWAYYGCVGAALAGIVTIVGTFLLAPFIYMWAGLGFGH